MPAPRSWTVEHIDYLESLVRQNRYTTQELATEMARQFHRRVTPAQINNLLRQMRTPSDPYFRDIPYSKPGARFRG